jgi:hypothetical protein
MLFPRIVRINQLATIDIDRNIKQSDPMNGFDIAITVISLILLVVLVCKCFFILFIRMICFSGCEKYFIV